jgi:GNAT superfamily N-acetyltransferase
VNDVDSFVAIRKAMLAGAPQAYTADVESDPGCDSTHLRQRLTADGFALVGAFRGDRLIGAAGLNRETRSKLRHRATLWGVWVDPEFRGKGVGEAIVRRCLELARAWPGLMSVSLSACITQTAAIRLYKRMGFEAWGVEPEMMRVNGSLHHEVHMRYALAGMPPVPSHAPQVDAMIAARTVRRMVTFAHVVDVEASVTFYSLLGFSPGDILRDESGKAFWAFASSGMGVRGSGRAEIMFARASGPVDASEQAVLFYMYCDNVALLRQHLLASGVRDGGRFIGCPGQGSPRTVFDISFPDYMEFGELRVSDPDGYCILIGQLQ